MPDLADSILAHLQAVDVERRRRSAQPELAARVVALKAYQQRRFAGSHADLLAHPRDGAAARFFLNDLYGPQDFAERDAQFARIVPALVRLFPQEIVATVDALAALHALSEVLDGEMAARLPAGPPDPAGYLQAWQAIGRPAERTRQIDLVLAVGTRLDQYTRNRWLRQTLKLMRTPAKAAGLHALQAFLEKGFDTFAAIGDAKAFLARIEARERRLVARLFEPSAPAALQQPLAAGDPLGELPPALATP